ncbi:MAG: response regulator [Oscillospiraceae bacterium]
MIALTVDDERPMLDALTAAVKASPDISTVTEFSSCTAVLDWIADNRVDVAFLDISMRGMGGLALAKKIAEAQPGCRIVFCTGHSEYAVEAFRLHVSGYLMKPVTAQAVQAEIDHIKGEKAKEKLLTVRCFGNFEVFSHGEPLYFRRTRTKELLAFLVDRNGAGVTARQICATLWEEDTEDAKNLNYLYQLFDDLRHALRSAGAESILLKNGISYALDTARLDCDYYQYLKTGQPDFLGEYMTQYSWAEETCAMLCQ